MPHKTALEWDQAFAEAFSNGDTDALLALYEPDAVWVTEPGQSVQGHAAIGLIRPKLGRRQNREDLRLLSTGSNHVTRV